MYPASLSVCVCVKMSVYIMKGILIEPLTHGKCSFLCKVIHCVVVAVC